MRRRPAAPGCVRAQQHPSRISSDTALASGLVPSKVVIHHPEHARRARPSCCAAARPGRRAPLPAIRCAGAHCAATSFVPEPGELYLLGPTTPTPGDAGGTAPGSVRARRFCTLSAPWRLMSPLRWPCWGPVRSSAPRDSAVAPGTQLDEHVFVNRGATIGHKRNTRRRLHPHSSRARTSRVFRASASASASALAQRSSSAS